MTTNTTPAKKPCPITLEQFKAAAPKLYVTVNRGDLTGADAVLWLAPKQFSTGSVGLWAQDKVCAVIGGLAVRCMAQPQFTLCGSKTAPKEVQATALAALKGMRLGFYFVAEGQTPPQGASVYQAITKAPFSTGSFGWNVSAKIQITEGQLQGDEFQVGINVTAIGSKPEAPTA